MVFRKIDPGVKEAAIYLLEMNWTQAEVVRLLYVSERSLRNWLRNMEAHGSVTPPKSIRQGRPSSMTSEQMVHLLQTVNESPWLYLDEIQLWLTLEYDVALSPSRIHQLLADAGYTRKMLSKAAKERDPVLRAEFINYCHQNIRANMLVAVDESSKDNRTLFRHFGRAPKGHAVIMNATADRGMRYSVLPALTVNGYMAVEVFEGSVNALQFIAFIIDQVLPQMNPFPGPQSVLLLDNCSIHTSDTLREAVEGAGCLVLFLPPYSPDYMPIEMSFATLKAYLRRNYNTAIHLDDPHAQILEACSSITPDAAKNWFKHCGYVSDD